LIVHTEKHRLHNPKLYFSLGRMSPYPEQPSRVETILAALKKNQIGTFEEPIDFGLEPILAIHSERYISYLQTAYDRWIVKGGDANGVIPDTFAVHLSSMYRDISLRSQNVLSQMGLFTFDAATVIAKDTYTAAYEACQVALTASHKLVQDGLPSAYALCRPPGHHSAEELLGGFCFFNNAAVAAEYLIRHHNKKVVILDIDYHHGNGTQTIFYQRSNPMFVSLHAVDSDPYYWGTEEERGEGEGLGYNVNVVLPDGTGDDLYLETLEKTIQSHIIPYNPDVLIISLGVDTFEGDPVGTFKITSPCFTKIGKLIKSVGVPTLFIQEGGYDSPELGVNVCNVLEGFQATKEDDETTLNGDAIEP